MMLEIAARASDPVLLEVLRNRFDGIANEMQLTLQRSSFSTIVKEGGDCSSALFTTQGETIALALAHPIHMSTMVPALKAVLSDYPAATMSAGDLYLMNDPYCGGTHLPDIVMVKPVFVDGSVIAFSVTLTHHQDVGGMSPGSIPTNAIEVFQEGLRLPPMKFCDRGVFNDTLLKIFRFNSRTPDEFLGDVDAQISACNTGDKRLRELAAIYPAQVLIAYIDALLDRSELMTRRALERLPQGTFRAVDWLDNDGVNLDQKVRIEVAVTVGDGRFHVDFTGTSPQTRGPINCTPGTTMSSVHWCVRALTGSDIPTNGGCYRPVSATLPEGSLVNPQSPAAVNARAATAKLICAPIIRAFASAMPERIPAASSHVALMMAFGGKWPDGRPFVTNASVYGGTGASPTADGVEYITTDVTNGTAIAMEVQSMNAPIRVRRFELRKDGGGRGKYRGGLGVIREYEFLTDDTRFTYRGERHYSPAPGLHGGEDGAPSRAVIHRADGRTEEIPSKAVVVMSRGDRVVIESAGGGGFGDPGERSSEDIQRDVADGKVGVASYSEI